MAARISPLAGKPAPASSLVDIAKLVTAYYSVYEQMQKGIFPRSVKAGPRAATWSEAAVQAWISDRLDGH